MHSTGTAPQGRISLSGKPLSEIMEDAVRPAEQQPQNPTAEKAADSDAESKIETHRQEFIERLKNRASAVCSGFREHGNRQRHRHRKGPVGGFERRDNAGQAPTSWSFLSRTAGLQGAIHLNVLVDESQKTARILKPEEKLIYFTKRNPQFTEFRKMLDLDAE
ncbi:MAG: hypothetical protein L6V35_01505 [Alistipes putredinis]|nr:MAG: hypothetical protein L6V35_01505 [Alistipes putredinis]